MGQARRDANHDETIDTPPPIAIDLRRLQPLEIVLIRRYVHDMPLDGLPAFDQVADEFARQLADLPQVALSFAHEVFGAFARSPYPVDRLNLGLMLRPLTLVDHDSGFALWHQLVRDVHPVVRRDVFQPIHQHLSSPAPTAEEELRREGLTLADGQQLRDAFIGAQYQGGCYVIGETAIAAALQEATHSFETIARI